MSACFIVLSALLSVSTVNGYRDGGVAGPATAMLRWDQVSGLVEVTGELYRKTNVNPAKSNSQAVTYVHTLDGTRYEVDMSAKAVSSLPCMEMPAREGGSRP